MEAEICIVMAVYKPEPAYFTEQIVSIAKQTDQSFVLLFVIADTTSAELATEAATAAGIRFIIEEPQSPLDAVRAFGLGLEKALGVTKSTYIALSDQDDIWHPERLAASRAALAKNGVDLVHSDARLVDAEGAVTHPSMFAYEGRRKKTGLRGLFYRNTITGMTVMMHRRLVEVALPLPSQSGVHFYHDLWLGLVANIYNGVHLIEKPLVDYRQHGANVVGAVNHQASKPRGFLKRLRSLDRMWLRRLAANYGLARYLAGSLHGHAHAAIATGLKQHGDAYLEPTGAFMHQSGGSASFLRDAVKLMLSGHFEVARIALNYALVSAGRHVWILRNAMTEGKFHAANTFDDRLYRLSPGMAPRVPTEALNTHRASQPERRVQQVSEIVDLRKTPKWKPEFSAQQRAFTIVVPTLNPSEVFAGIATAIDFGLGLAEKGHNVRFITSDLPIACYATSERFLLGRMSLDAAPDTASRITLHCSIQEDTIPSHIDDVFMATAWWSAHIIDTVLKENTYNWSRFFYLIQDFEPNFYAWGPEYADAWASYSFDFEPVFNTSLLRQYFVDQGFTFATEDRICFRPSIDISHYTSGKRSNDGYRKRLALYGRPEVARNMFPTSIEALAGFITEQELGPDDIEIVSIGLKHDNVELPNGVSVVSLGKLSWDDYPNYLLTVDFGLCLMYSPHPSHPPIEMAASGARVVTNHFGPKDLSDLSPAILSGDANAASIKKALTKAWKMPVVSNAERQIDLSLIGVTTDEAITALSQTLTSKFWEEGLQDA